MKEQFVPYETSKMLKELGFDEPCFGLYGIHGEFRYSHEAVQLYRPKNSDLTICTTAPLWQQVKQWLFDRQSKVRIDVARSQGEYFVGVFKEGLHLFSIDAQFNSPITAEIEGIKKAVEYLHEKIKPQ